MVARIYQIKNNANGKIYVGCTEKTIQERFKAHIKDAKKRRYSHRPMYQEMNKYGIEHFSVALIEETDDPIEREQFWIKELRAVQNGYNTSLGGDGKHTCDHDLIYGLWCSGMTIREIHSKSGYDVGWIGKVLRAFGVSPKELQERAHKHARKRVGQYDIETGALIRIFSSCSNAGHALGDIEKKKTISHACRGDIGSAYGYLWKYID